MGHITSLIRSKFEHDGKCTAVFLIDGTKISISRDSHNGAWLKIEATPLYTVESAPLEARK